jgi:Tol biopolymer transport system component
MPIVRSVRRRRRLYAAASLWVLTACSAADSTSPSAIPATGKGTAELLILTGRIAFVRGRHIYVMKADGSGVTQLTHSTAANDWPAWSPNGSKIAFVRELSVSTEIFVMNANGAGVTRLTNNAINEETPVWSPNGTKIAFVRLGQRDEIYVMNADGSNVTQLTNNLPFQSCGRLSRGREASPTWSPDGTKIAFLHAASCFREDIDIMNANGTGVTLLANAGAAQTIAWGKTGKIAFDARRWPGDTSNDAEIGVVTVSTGSVTRLTNNAAQDLYPTWSPDGTKLAFQSDRDGDLEIYAMSAAGTGLTKLTRNSVYDVDPAWGP